LTAPDRRTLRRVVEAAGADALLIVGSSSRDPDLAPFTGDARLGDCFVVVRGDGSCWLGYHSLIEREEAAAAGIALLDPATLRVGEPARRGDGASLGRSLSIALQETAISGRRIALAGRHANGELALALGALRRRGFRFSSGHHALLALRRPKRGVDLDEMRTVAAATCDALRQVARILTQARPAAARRHKPRAPTRRRAARSPRAALEWRAAPLTVGVLRREVAALLARAGLEQPDQNLIAPAGQGAVPHNVGDPSSVLRAGESLIVDLFPRRRLHADCTRTFCVGEPPPELRAAHAAVLAALEVARGRARLGAVGFELHQEVCRHFEALGYSTVLRDRAATSGYVHGLGHGVGYQVHELPHFRRDATSGDGELARDDVFTLEPGLYDPGAGWAVRLEDLCYLGARGVENLTPLPYDLDPRAWARADAR
jgi:Xaa-Pro aminopeptidase